MINEHLYKLLKSSFDFDYTRSQELCAKAFASFLVSDNCMEVFLLKGYAGTGKTSLVSSFVKCLTKLNFRLKLMAPTGRAAKVFTSFAHVNCNTIHKTIYRQQSNNNGFGSFKLNTNKLNNTIFFVDEASMIVGNSYENTQFGSGNLLSDLIDFVYQGDNCKLVLIGDNAQLPPVGSSESVALDAHYLSVNGLTVNECFLSDVVRQVNNSGILNIANSLRQKIENDSSLENIPNFNLKGFNDVKRVSGADFVDTLQYAYDLYGQDNVLLVNRSNNRANMYNSGIRNTILNMETELAVGDYVMVVKNNYHWLRDEDEVDFIANGDIAEIVKIKSHQELYGFRFADCVIRLIDYKELEIEVKILLDVLDSSTSSLSREQQESFFNEVMQDYFELGSKKNKYEAVKSNEYYNALQVKFAYAITCHKSQGGQWKAVFVDPGFVTPENINRDYYRWLYTAFTRCTEQLYLLNFSDEYFS